MLTLIINLIGLGLIAAIIAWFWLIKPKAYHSANPYMADILVKDGVYTPSNIEVLANIAFRLTFHRKDPSPCAETVIFPSLNISKHLPLNEKVDVVVTPPKAGEYEFTCQMGMYRGKLIAR